MSTRMQTAERMYTCNLGAKKRTTTWNITFRDRKRKTSKPSFFKWIVVGMPSSRYFQGWQKSNHGIASAWNNGIAYCRINYQMWKTHHQQISQINETTPYNTGWLFTTTIGWITRKTTPLWIQHVCNMYDINDSPLEPTEYKMLGYILPQAWKEKKFHVSNIGSIL